MAEVPACRVALLSVHPEYAQAILDGTKTVEFRKRPLADDVTHVAIYATRPVGRIVGVFRIEEQVQRAPGTLWKRFKDVGGISYSKFLAYYDGHPQGVGIRVGDLVRIDGDVTLEDAFGISRPPQSFQYFEPDEASERLRFAFA